MTNKILKTASVFMLLVLTLFQNSTLAQTPTASIATWKDDSKAAFTIIHDDYSDYVPGIFQYAHPMAKARGIKLCFGAITSACGLLSGASWEGFILARILGRLQPDKAWFWQTQADAELDLLAMGWRPTDRL